jgi:hypothetical protein
MQFGRFLIKDRTAGVCQWELFAGFNCIQERLHKALKSAVDFSEIDFQSRFCDVTHTSWGVQWQSNTYTISDQLEAVCGHYDFFKGASYTVVNWVAVYIQASLGHTT